MFSCEFCEIYQNSLFTEHELLEISFNLKDFTDLFEIELFTSLISFSLRNIFSPSLLLKVGVAYARKLSWIFKSFSSESSPSQKIFEEVGFLRCIHLDQLTKDNREITSWKKTEMLTKSMNIYIWTIGTSNQLFTRGSYTQIKFWKKLGSHWQKSILCDRSFSYSLFNLS